MRFLTSLILKYSKVFKFKGFHRKRKTPKGGGWALGPWDERKKTKTDIHINVLHVTAPEGGKVGALRQGF